MLDNVELIMYKEFQKLLMNGCRENIKNAPKMGVSPISDTPRFLFKNRALSLLYPYGSLNSCKKLEKTNDQSLRYLKTDGHTHGLTHTQTRAITKDPFG